jgi:hypothetical protein
MDYDVPVAQKEYNIMKISKLTPINALKPEVTVVVLAGLPEIANFLYLYARV